MTVRIIHGDCVEVLRTLEAESVHSVVCDPPYGLEFMGKEWDSPKHMRGTGPAAGFGQVNMADGADRLDRPSFMGGGQLTCMNCGGDKYRGATISGGRARKKCECAAPSFRNVGSERGKVFQEFCEAWARECLRVLKPGGHLLSFGGSRTYHRMACAIEDAGFEIRDQIFWCYGSGFPKSLNVNKALEADDAVCRCSEDRIHLQRVPHSDDALRIADEAQESADLLLPLQRNVARGRVGNARVERCERTQELHGIEGVSESGLEGRSNDLQEEGQLHQHPVRPSARVGEANGAAGRLRDATPPSDGGVVRPIADACGDGSSPQPSTDREPANESGTVAGQPQPQARGAWPICDRCSKPMVAKGLGTALKPAHEPIVVARKPLIGTVAANVLKHGTGALNIDGCRVAHDEDCRMMAASQANIDTPSDKCRQAGRREAVLELKPGGRWPANIIHDGSDEVLAGFPAEAGAHPVGLAAGNYNYAQGGQVPSDKPFDFGDSGSAARFFYTAKASGDDRNIGSQAEHERNGHPTVKPTDLMQHLVRLVTPPGGTVLDPFAGSGSTGLAADREGFDAILIEREAEYVEIARRRIVGDCPLFAELAA